MDSKLCLAVLPRYEQWVGNVCELYGLHLEIVVCHHTLKTQMRKFFRDVALDEQLYLKRAREILGIRKGIPLAYGSDRVFLPVRTRVPNIKNDGAHAYIRLNAIAKVRDYSIELIGGTKLDCLQSKSSLETAMQRARTIEAFLRLEEEKNRVEREMVEMLLKEGRMMAAENARAYSDAE